MLRKACDKFEAGPVISHPSSASSDKPLWYLNLIVSLQILGTKHTTKIPLKHGFDQGNEPDTKNMPNGFWDSRYDMQVGDSLDYTFQLYQYTEQCMFEYSQRCSCHLAFRTGGFS